MSTNTILKSLKKSQQIGENLLKVSDAQEALLINRLLSPFAFIGVEHKDLENLKHNLADAKRNLGYSLKGLSLFHFHKDLESIDKLNRVNRDKLAVFEGKAKLNPLVSASQKQAAEVVGEQAPKFRI